MKTLRLPRVAILIILGLSIVFAGCFGAETTPQNNSRSQYFTYKSIAGVSMGGGASAHLALNYPDRWDSIGILGAPLVDHTSLFRMIKRNWLGGFCTYPTMMRFLADGKDLNSTETFCGIYTDQIGDNLFAERPILPTEALDGQTEQPMEVISDYNNWWRGPNGGRGGSFKRVSLMKALLDIQKGFGNSLYLPNTEIPWAAPGITKEWLALSDEDKCDNPIINNNFYNAEYNPEGTYPVITFCEGEEDDERGTPESLLGRITPETSRDYPVLGLLAIDYNRNGVRDYSEPVIINPNERYDDFGTDGLPDDLEEGYDPQTNPDPANDNYHYFLNPTGTERNYQRDPEEPYADFGIDGVANTRDYGEGDGQFTESPAIEHSQKYNPTHLINQLSAEELGRLSIYLDAGIRDFLNTPVGTNAFFANLKTKVPADLTVDYNGFSALEDEYGNFDPSSFPPEKLKPYTYVRYGKIDATEKEISQGDGNHVGTIAQVFDRMLSAMSVAQEQWPNTNRDTTPLNPAGNPDYSGVDSYESATLGKTKEFGYIIPPGYLDPENAEERYPVFFFLHGQGQKYSDLLGASIIMLSNMVESDAIDISRWGKFITIFPDGKCEEDVCSQGNFWVDSVNGKEDQRYFTDFYELVEIVDQRFRTKSPEWVDIPN